MEVRMFGKESYIGFTFGQYHSSHFNIVVTMDGRYQDAVLPNFENVMTQLPNARSLITGKSNFTARSFVVTIAYDNLSLQQVQEMKGWLSREEPQKLVFDEKPYAQYQAIATGLQSLTFIPFDEGERVVYKGEGQLNFIAPDPLGKSPHRSLNDFDDKNKDEWAKASGIPETNNGDVAVTNESGLTIDLYNPGDVETDFKIYFKVDTSNGINGDIVLTVTKSGESEYSQALVLNFSGVDIETDVVYCLDSHLQMIYDTRNKTKNINKSLRLGTFFSVPTGRSRLKMINSNKVGISIVRQNGIDITYDYKYY